jgi:hypothetical protein
MTCYPKWLYHAAHEPIIVRGPVEHDAMGAEWVESPVPLKPGHQAQAKTPFKQEVPVALVEPEAPAPVVEKKKPGRKPKVSA